ncbi:hypothetical protein WICPIJ_000565 [Wickerhamomyces pijperi]|uniref:Uncharacterized protein n=1 Tax=Wickerhamomyces pijperi TaxID=599730 RepID=A0A9P8TRK0_WICPI|nr:hypothetical protein WICPIJ_000565 [Wickerhamomyces pijperi]
MDPVSGPSSLGEKFVVGDVLMEFLKLPKALMNWELLLFVMDECDVEKGYSVGEFLKDLAVWKESGANCVEPSLVDGALISAVASILIASVVFFIISCAPGITMGWLESFSSWMGSWLC